MKNHKSFLLLCLSLLMMVQLTAQQRQILHGKVTSQTDKLALIGVSVAEYDSCCNQYGEELLPDVRLVRICSNAIK